MTGPTVYDVIADWFNGDTGPWDLMEDLGIDPQMPVETLRRLLKSDTDSPVAP